MIAQRHDVPELLARILAGRNVEVDAVEAFLDPTIKRTMPDPNVLTAMPEAAGRIADAIVRGEQVAIFGDYDVDGATSAALLARLGTLAARLQARREARVVTGTRQEQPQHLSRRRLEIRKLFDWFRAIQARV
jgi:hypothetical protein